MANSTRLHQKAMGVAGLGKIGAAIARRAAGIGMDVAWYDPYPKPDVPWPSASTLEDLARRSDVLVLAVPGGGGTDGLINAEVLEALGPRGWFINVSRGSAVDETALIEALETGRIAGAGLDVFATEPGIDPRFLTLPNVVLTPHYASITNEAREEIVALILQNIERFLSGQPIPNAAA
jgi:phosphoglycerate dehydrogenase-like enzyme